MSSLLLTGIDFLKNVATDFIVEIVHQSPVEFNEKNRYLPESVSAMPGYIDFSAVPYMEEILQCADRRNSIREVTLMKGVQIGYTTMLESVAFYFMVEVGTLPMMWVTADQEAAKIRLDNNLIPMLDQSGFNHILRSSDRGNNRKTGQTKMQLQFAGGGYMLLFGAKSPTKLRSAAISVLLKDENDGWPNRVGKDGDPDKLVDARAKGGYWKSRKIFNGSTPLMAHDSKIAPKFKKGDQRRYFVKCKKCNEYQILKWKHDPNPETGIIGGFYWDHHENGVLDLDSVRYECQYCGEPHFEHDKERLFSKANGAEWRPTATPSRPDLRSYHLPGLYSPASMCPWDSHVSDYLEAFDPEENRVIDIEKYQTFYNNVLGETFEVRGYKLQFHQVSAHRRTSYTYGEVPNKFAEKYSGSHIVILTCQVDVHLNNLAVAVMGWTSTMCCYTIDYWRFNVGPEEPDATDPDAPVWDRFNDLIRDKIYTADDGRKYRIEITLVDASWQKDTVTTVTAKHEYLVYPIIGVSGSSRKVSEFQQWKTKSGRIGYQIDVDHYKDRMSTVLRRGWGVEDGEQKVYHFNVPVDATDKQLKELTTETRIATQNEKGAVSYSWSRKGDNEFWDLLGYGYAAVEIVAWNLCVEHFGLEEINWPQFWEYVIQEKLYCTAPDPVQSGVEVKV